MKKYTDQEFLYRQIPVNYDGIAKFTSIKGNTLVWNQLAKELNATNWLAESATVSYSNGICTLTPSGYNGRISADADIKANHKYLMLGDFTNVDNQPVYFYIGAIGSYNTGIRIPQTSALTRQSKIYTATETGKIYVRNNSNTGVVTIKNLMLIDLNLLGLESITDPSEFTSLFPLPYYSYNQGTLLSFKGTGIKTVGKNLLPLPNAETKNGVTLQHNADGSITFTGTASSLTYFDCFPSGDFDSNFFEGCIVTLDGATTSGNFYIRVSKSDRVGLQAIYNNSTVSNNGNGLYLAYRIAQGYSFPSDGMTIKQMMRFAGVDASFEPYETNTTSLPTETYFPTGMKSAGTVYDELTETKAITRVGSVDLGTLNWIYNANYGMYTNGIASLIKRPSSASTKANIVCAIRETDTWSAVFNAGTSGGKCGVTTTGEFGMNTTETDPTTFKSSMSGVYLYYELATETETDAEDIFYKFYGNGTEEILPVNGSSPETSPIIADIEYYNQIDSETPYRKFWLVNGNGDRWNLTEKEVKSFLDGPQGLGFQKSIDVTRYGERAYKNTETYNFPQVSGDILFYDTINATRYEKYNEFVRFLMQQPLTLYYQIPVSIYSGMADIYTLDCEVINLTKTESKTNRVLTSNIQINGLGFYEGDTVEINGTSATVTINNDGDFPVGFEIEIIGDMKNPYFTLEQDGEMYGEAKFEDDIDNFSSVYVDSKDGEQNVVLKQNDLVLPNPLAYQDLSISNGSVYVTFVKLEKGVSTLAIGMDGDFDLTSVNIKFTPQYRSV